MNSPQHATARTLVTGIALLGMVGAWSGTISSYATDTHAASPIANRATIRSTASNTPPEATHLIAATSGRNNLSDGAGDSDNLYGAYPRPCADLNCTPVPPGTTPSRPVTATRAPESPPPTPSR